MGNEFYFSLLNLVSRVYSQLGSVYTPIVFSPFKKARLWSVHIISPHSNFGSLVVYVLARALLFTSRFFTTLDWCELEVSFSPLL